MKNISVNTILQIVAIIFLVIIGYMTFNSSGNWKLMKSELKKVEKEIQRSKDTLSATKKLLTKSQLEFKQLKVQKDLIIHQRDSLLLAFKRKNAKDWDELQIIKDSIKSTNDQLSEDRLLLKNLFGLNKE